MDRKDIEMISTIADAALGILRANDVKQDKLSIVMDLEYIHEQSPLRLEEMRATAISSPDTRFADLAHDILGIHNHWNRVTKTMEDCFVPRFTL